MRYKIISDEDGFRWIELEYQHTGIDTLADAVEFLSSKGWKLHGGTMLVRPSESLNRGGLLEAEFAQAMTWEKPADTGPLYPM